MTKNNDTVLFTVSNGVGVITLNRPEKLNSFTEDLHVALRSCLQTCADNRDIRAVLIKGAGRAFCAGQDLNERKDLDLANLDLGEKIDDFYNPLILSMRNMHKPIVAAVHGVAAGAGASLALACDIIVASQEAQFIQAFCKIALVPDSGATWFLTRSVGECRAKYLALTGEPVGADDAYKMGMISKVVPEGEAISTAMGLAEHLAKGPTATYTLIKDAIQKATDNTLQEQLTLERDFQRLAGKTSDYKEGVTAFQKKRPAEFTGE